MKNIRQKKKSSVAEQMFGVAEGVANKK